MNIGFRNNSLVFLSAIAFSAVLVMAVMTFDALYYQKAKKQMIEDLAFPHFPINDQTLHDNVDEFLRSREPRPDLEQRIVKGMDSILAQDAPITIIRVVRNGKVLIERHRTKERIFDTFRNSLLLRNFRSNIKTTFPDPKEPSGVMGQIVFTYATPLHFEPIEALTRRYWGYLGILVTVVSAAYILMLRLLILPIKKVTEAIQGSRAHVAQFIAKPRSRLERLYNSMARDALLSAITSGLSNPRSRQLRMTLADLFSFLSPRITEWFGFDGVWLFDLAWEGPKKVSPVRQLPAERDGAPAWHIVGEAFDGALVRNLRTSWESKTAQILSSRIPSGDARVYVGVISTAESETQLRVLTLIKRGITERDQIAWYESTAESIYRHVVGLVERQAGQSKELFREKSEANISLSRNLGHDLTNIIATSKLELMTVTQILHGDPSTWFDTQEKTDILRESLTRLLDNTRSLQEIVNLYRAYEYLKSPRYEPTDINRLIEELIAIFRLSMSAPVDISCEFTTPLPAVEIEPRLIKLALFNLLSNAQDAVRRLPFDEQAAARIVLRTSAPDAARVVIRVSDTGPGILGPDGRPAGAEHIERIFDLGYTTKAGGDGEGLGLNWVRTILTEFHSGELTAYNNPEGGATFEFSLPVPKNASPTGNATQTR